MSKQETTPQSALDEALVIGKIKAILGFTDVDLLDETTWTVTDLIDRCCDVWYAALAKQETPQDLGFDGRWVLKETLKRLYQIWNDAKLEQTNIHGAAGEAMQMIQAYLDQDTGAGTKPSNLQTERQTATTSEYRRFHEVVKKKDARIAELSEELRDSQKYQQELAREVDHIRKENKELQFSLEEIWKPEAKLWKDEALRVGKDYEAVKKDRDQIRDKLAIAQGALEKIETTKSRSGVPSEGARIAKDALGKIKQE